MGSRPRLHEGRLCAGTMEEAGMTRLGTYGVRNDKCQGFGITRRVVRDDEEGQFPEPPLREDGNGAGRRGG